MFRLVLGLAFLLAIVNSSPLERSSNNGGLVVDVPAVDFGAEGQDSGEAIQKPKIAEDEIIKDVEIIPLRINDGDSASDSDSSIEDIEIKPQQTDFFGFRLPQLFIYRRPVIRDPFAGSPFGSFPFFQQQQPQQHTFTPAQPSQFNVMNHMEQMMKRMQEQMTSLWGAMSPNYNRPPLFNRPIFNIDSSASASGEKAGDKDTSDFLNIDTLPANYSNSTSETKIVDGQLVQVNKTIHKISSNDSSGFFQVQVIKIRPQTVPTTTQVPTTEVAGSSTSEPAVKQDAPAAPIVPVADKTSTTVSAAKNEAASTTIVVATTEKPEDPAMNEIDGNKKEVSGVDQGLLDVEPEKKA